MKRRYELTEDADADINALWLYIAQNRSPDTADRLANRIYDAFELLAENPFMGIKGRNSPTGPSASGT
jgi:plasmid stabilization system protein ParE